MKDSFLFSNNPSVNENIDNIFNLNSPIQKDEPSSNIISYLDSDIKEEKFNNIFIKNNSIFKEEENFNNINMDINQDISSINPSPIQEQEYIDDYCNNIFEKSQNEQNLQISSYATSPSPPPSSTSISNPPLLNYINEKGDKNKSNKNSIINIEIEKDKSQNTTIPKKRKQRIHLEDLNIDPEIIKYKKYQTIGDKVITSKNSKITDLDRKEIRAIRNRISAQKSRDKKKQEFNNLQMRVKFFEELIKKLNLIIKDFERTSCPECKSKFTELKLNLSLEQNIEENEYLVLDEEASFFTSSKKSSILGKLTGALIALVCLICIIICSSDTSINKNQETKIKFDNRNTINNIKMKIYRNNDRMPLRQLSEKKALNIENFRNNNEDDNNNDEGNNIKIKDENILLPVNPILDNGIYLNYLRLYHERFGIDIYSYLKKKNRAKNGFLLKQQSFNETDDSMCIETKNIEHNNYIIDNNSIQNTLPVEANNIVIDNNLSHKIISLFVKDYNTLNRYINGKSLTLQEQIEIEAKNSEDGCVYLQMIIPNNDYDGESPSFFEIRGKIFAYNNYYASKLATTTTY